MANNQGTQQGGQQASTPNASGSVIQQLQGNQYTLEQSLSVIAHAFEANPNALQSLSLGRRAATESQSNFSENKWKFSQDNPRDTRSRLGRSSGSIVDEFEAGIREQLLDSLAGGSFKEGIQGALSTFASEFGMELKDVPREFGRRVGRELFERVGNIQIGESTIGQQLSTRITDLSNSLIDNIFRGEGNQALRDGLRNTVQSFFQNGNTGNIGDIANSVLGNGGNAASEAASQAASEAASNAASNVASNAASEAASQAASQAASEAAANAASQAASSAASQAAASAASSAASSSAASAAAGAAGAAGTAGAAGAAGAAGGAAGAATAGTAAGGILGGAGAGAAGAGAGAAGAGIAAGGMSALAATGWGLLIIGIIYTIVKILGPALKGLADMAVALGKSYKREEEIRKKRLQEAQNRLKADIEYLTKRPFEILEEATKKWEDAWDSHLRQIGQTQGYDKESVYALYEGYAERLRSERLDKSISATDVIDKLSSVLDSGLSGQAAEEFAYMATKLNAAIPTQDFFSYVDTYASIAANAISQGKTQKEALAAANAELEQFASNLLYSSRELAGGFTTGLKDGASLFKDATQIAQSAKTYNASAISGTLTSVSAIIGAVAPDLASSLVSNVVQAAIGGNNNSQIVALRSLAGINAGNTEFLRAMAENPKAIFSELFTNLANMQNMSPDNYMEVAEGLADVFGIDKAAFARVDFNYLANAINSMNVNDQSLQANMDLLVSGQTTTSAEQLKAQKVNSVILEEGLAYIIDSEAGRMIQQHMWDEQLAVELENATYAVDLQGSALSFLEGIRKTVTNLLNFLNPLGAISKGISNMTKTMAEAIGNDEDIKEVLSLTAVGKNTRSFNNLTTRGKDLKLTDSYVEMLGGTKGIAALNNISSAVRFLGNAESFIRGGGIPTSDMFNMAADAITTNFTGTVADAIDRINGTYGQHGSKSSRYNWGTVGKTLAKAVQNTPINTATLSAVAKETASATQLAQQRSDRNFEAFMSTAQEAAAKKMSYDEWAATAKKSGISDLSAALEEYGRSEQELRDFFETAETAAGAKVEEERKKDEELFRKENREYWAYTNGTGGIFYTAVWFPFFGEGQKYDTRMDAVDLALSTIQTRIGLAEQHTVIGGIEELSRKLGDDKEYTVIGVLSLLEKDVHSTFMEGSTFQRCLADWTSYITSKEKVYNPGVSKSSAWSDLKSAEGNKQSETLLALANAMNVFSADQLKNLDPQLQANALLGEIVILLQTIMQQNNKQAGGLSLIDTISALGLGATKK